MDNVISRFSLPESNNDKAAEAMAVILPAVLVQAMSAVLEAAGAAPEAAEDTARHLASAEERGVSTHGVRRLPALVAALESEDADEGPRAFREKREPDWMGR